MMATANRDGMLQMTVVLIAFFCTFQFIFGTSLSCIPEFHVKYPKLRSEGAAPLLNVQNDEGCKTACLSDKRCVSYQIDTDPEHNLCWIQLNAEKLVLDNMYELKSVTEYILVNRCSDPANLQTVSPTPRSCIPEFHVKYPWFRSAGAAPLLKPQNNEDCKTACLSDNSCVSYQIDTDPEHSLCWIQVNAEKLVLDNMYELRSVTEYILVNQCSDPGVDKSTIKPNSCWPIFENKNPGWVSFSALNAPDVKTEDKCKTACVGIPACVSYQIQTNLSGIFCWLQYNQQKLSKDQMYQSDTIKEYIRVDKCSESPELKLSSKKPDICSPVFEKKNPGWVSRLATSAPDAKTEDECKNACVRIPACVSYLISRKTGGILCWLQHNQQQLDKARLKEAGSTEEYILVKRCQVSTEHAEKECYVTMKPSLFGQLSSNATLLISAKDERTCVAACIASSDCISVQFKLSDRNLLCFLQHDFLAFKPENLIYHPNVTEYVIIKRCDKDNACSLGFPLKQLPIYFRIRRTSDTEVTEKDRDEEDHRCKVLVQLVNRGLSTAKGVPFKSALTDADCIAACVADKTCVSSQHQRHFSDGSFACFLQHDIEAFESRKLFYRPDVTEYIISRRCNQTTSVD